MSYVYDERAPITRIRPSAEMLIKSLEDLQSARESLNKAIEQRPPECDPSFYKREQDAYNRAANAYEDAVIQSVKASL